MSPVSSQDHQPHPAADTTNNVASRCAGHRAEASLTPTAPAAPAHHAVSARHAHGAHAAGGSIARLTTAATLHCLTGCAIGELAGLAIGVSLGLGAWPTMALATTLGFVSGYSLGLRPLLQRGMGLVAAFKAIWLGETLSIAAMELTMNFADFHVGGMNASSILSSSFWLGYAVALPAGFLAAWPVNYLLLSKSIKQPCH